MVKEISRSRAATAPENPDQNQVTSIIITGGLKQPLLRTCVLVILSHVDHDEPIKGGKKVPLIGTIRQVLVAYTTECLKSPVSSTGLVLSDQRFMHSPSEATYWSLSLVSIKVLYTNAHCSVSVVIAILF